MFGDRETDIEIGKETVKEADQETEIETGKEADRETDRRPKKLEEGDHQEGNQGDKFYIHFSVLFFNSR